MSVTKIIYGERGTGKTTKLLEMANASLLVGETTLIISTVDSDSRYSKEQFKKMTGRTFKRFEAFVSFINVSSIKLLQNAEYDRILLDLDTWEMTQSVLKELNSRFDIQGVDACTITVRPSDFVLDRPTNYVPIIECYGCSLTYQPTKNEHDNCYSVCPKCGTVN